MFAASLNRFNSISQHLHMIRRNIVLLLVSLCLLSAGAFAQSSKSKGESLTLFSVNKKPVSVDEFVYLYKKNHQNTKSDFTKEKIQEYLDLFINFKLKVTEAQARGLDTTRAFKKEFNTYRDELRKPYLPDSKIVDSLVALTYERMKEEVNASHVLIKVPEGATESEDRAALNKIVQIRERAMKGEDFATLAESLSEDLSAKMNKGSLGYFSALQMVYPFETAAYTTREGDISMPFKTQFGYHILKVNDRRPSSGEVEVAHILIRTGENKDNDQAKNTIFDIYDQLQKGVSWEELCKQYSEDLASRETGGKVRPFGIGAMASSIPEFEQAAFQLQKPGEYSDPFQTQYGWHIVKLERKIPLPSFQDASTSIKNRVMRDERVQASKQALYERLKERHGYSVNEAVKKKVLALADTSLLQGKWKPGAYENDQEVLFNLGGKKFTVKSFLQYAVQNQKRSTVSPGKSLENLLTTFSESQLLQLVEENVIAKSPEYKWLLNEYYEGILLFDIMEKEVWNKASIDSAGQRAYFEKNASTYKAGERVKAVIYSATTQDHIEKLKTQLEQNDSLRVAETISSFKIRNEAGLFEKDDRIVLSKIPWATGVHLAENNNLFYVVNVKAILPPGLKTFQEARADVISDYQNFLEKKWIADLKKKHPVKVNKKGKEAAFAHLLEQKTM
jgi:peptidyl-prolyl cis-trans isomerase SurA